MQQTMRRDLCQRNSVNWIYRVREKKFRRHLRESNTREPCVSQPRVIYTRYARKTETSSVKNREKEKLEQIIRNLLPRTWRGSQLKRVGGLFSRVPRASIHRFGTSADWECTGSTQGTISRRRWHSKAKVDKNNVAGGNKRQPMEVGSRWQFLTKFLRNKQVHGWKRFIWSRFIAYVYVLLRGSVIMVKSWSTFRVSSIPFIQLFHGNFCFHFFSLSWRIIRTKMPGIHRS